MRFLFIITTILHFSERLHELQEKLEGMAKHLQEKEQVNRQKENQLLYEIDSLKSKLSSTDAALLQAEDDMTTLMESSKGTYYVDKIY